MDSFSQQLSFEQLGKVSLLNVLAMRLFESAIKLLSRIHQEALCRFSLQLQKGPFHSPAVASRHAAHESSSSRLPAAWDQHGLRDPLFTVIRVSTTSHFGAGFELEASLYNTNAPWFWHRCSRLILNFLGSAPELRMLQSLNSGCIYSSNRC